MKVLEKTLKIYVIVLFLLNRLLTFWNFTGQMSLTEFRFEKTLIRNYTYFLFGCVSLWFIWLFNWWIGLLLSATIYALFTTLLRFYQKRL